jgi:hypothetical protein
LIDLCRRISEAGIEVTGGERYDAHDHDRNQDQDSNHRDYLYDPAHRFTFSFPADPQSSA